MSTEFVKYRVISAHSRHDKKGIILPVIALILPVFAGFSFVIANQSFETVAVLSACVVVTTSILMLCDALINCSNDGQGKRRNYVSYLVFLIMCFFWFLGYPLAFFRRRHFGGPGLGIPSVLVVLFFLGFPLVASYITGTKPRLPSCDSTEVIELLERIISSSAIGQKKPVLHGYQTVAYDNIIDRSTGKFFVNNGINEVEIRFFVEWLDRNKGKFQVRIQSP